MKGLIAQFTWLAIAAGVILDLYATRYVSAETHAAIHRRASFWPAIVAHPWLSALLLPLVFLSMGLVFAGGAALMVAGQHRWMSVVLALGFFGSTVLGFRWVQHAK